MTQTTTELPPTVVIQATRGLSALQLRALWEYRELLYFMVWRDVKVRYKQTALGVAWVVLQPLLSTLVFTVIFGVLLEVPSNGLPYPIFAYAGLLPWQYFAGSLTRTSTNLVDNANLITKVYFPRLTIPLSGVLGGLVDFAVGFVVAGCVDGGVSRAADAGGALSALFPAAGYDHRAGLWPCGCRR
jgi:lipopolysaccharide transport system permease protein